MNRLLNFISRVAWRCLHPIVLRFSPCEWRSIDDLPPQDDDEKEWENRCVVVWQDAEHETDQGVEVTNLAQIRYGDFRKERYINPVWRSVMDAPIYTQNKEYELLWEKAQANKPKGTQAKIELLYNGDYPGYPCVRVNYKWLTTEETALLCKIFKTNNLIELYDKVGLSKNWDGIPSEEHEPFTGVIAISQ